MGFRLQRRKGRTMLLDQSQPQQSLARQHSDGGRRRKSSRGKSSGRAQVSQATSQAQGSSSSFAEESQVTRKPESPELDKQGQAEQTVKKFVPPDCHNGNLCGQTRLKVITVKRVNRCVVRYMKCPRCGNTSKHVEPLA